VKRHIVSNLKIFHFLIIHILSISDYISFFFLLGIQKNLQVFGFNFFKRRFFLNLPGTLVSLPTPLPRTVAMFVYAFLAIFGSTIRTILAYKHFNRYNKNDSETTYNILTIKCINCRSIAAFDFVHIYEIAPMTWTRTCATVAELSARSAAVSSDGLHYRNNRNAEPPRQLLHKRNL